ncbi:MAG: FIST N-terminal domain-containing protein [Mariprofundus sp.]|nr:FIST N-terminal domain-containing protein [Mariprofundus sp.]
MQIVEGSSSNPDAFDAIVEATGHWADDVSPDILFVFHSSAQYSPDVAAALHTRFPNTLIAGCTTAGEWISGQHKNSSLVLSAITTPDIRWASAVIENLNDSAAESAKSVCNAMLTQLDIACSELNPEHYFCLSFFDGLSTREEPVIAAMANELGNIPLLGGSAGDDLKFEHTFVIANGKTYQHAALFILAESRVPFHAVKHQHYMPGDIDVVITKADVDKRLVYRLDGIPAAERYAQLLGIEMGDLTAQIFSDNPLTYPYGDECYVRALRRVCEDNSLEFGCAIEEGMVLNLCKHQNMIDEYNKFITEIKQQTGKAELLLICNCIYRALEGSDANINQQLAEKTTAISNHVIGFDTYGEQWQGLHVNQTLVALALGSA